MNLNGNPVQPDAAMLERALKRMESDYPPMSVTSLLAFLEKLPPAGWALCGGGAVASYAERKISPDLDILISEAAAQAARKLCPPEDRVSNLIGETWHVAGLDMDLVFCAGPADTYALEHAARLRFKKQILRIVPVEWLAAAKVRLGRETDHADVELLWPVVKSSGKGLWRLVTFCRLYYPEELADLLASYDSINRSLSG